MTVSYYQGIPPADAQPSPAATYTMQRCTGTQAVCDDGGGTWINVATGLSASGAPCDGAGLCTAADPTVPGTPLTFGASYCYRFVPVQTGATCLTNSASACIFTGPVYPGTTSILNKAAAAVGKFDYGFNEAAKMLFMRWYSDANAASGAANSLGWHMFGHPGAAMASDAAYLWCGGFTSGWPLAGNAAAFPLGGVTDQCASGCVRDGFLNGKNNNGVNFDAPSGSGTAGTASDPAQNWYLSAACARVTAGPGYTVSGTGINHRFEFMRPYTSNGKDPNYLANDHASGHTIDPFVAVTGSAGFNPDTDANLAKHTQASYSGTAFTGIFYCACTAPAAPTGFAATDVGASYITLSWGAPADNGARIRNYKLWRNGVGIIATTVDTTYTVSGLTFSTMYQFKVAAVNGRNDIATEATPPGALTIWSPTPAATWLQVTTLAPPPPPTPTVAPACTPSGFSVAVDWTTAYPCSMDGCANGFRVQVLQGATPIAGSPFTVAWPTHTYTVTGLTAMTSYTISVAGVNSVGTSAYSPVWTGSTLGAPPAPTLSPNEGSAGYFGLTVTWTTRYACPECTLGFAVYVCAGAACSPLPTPGTTSAACTTAAGVWTCAVTGLTSGTQYAVYVAGRNDVGWSAVSPAWVVSTTSCGVTTLVGAARVPWVSAMTYTGLKTSWSVAGTTQVGTLTLSYYQGAEPADAQPNPAASYTMQRCAGTKAACDGGGTWTNVATGLSASGGAACDAAGKCTAADPTTPLTFSAWYSYRFVPVQSGAAGACLSGLTSPSTEVFTGPVYPGTTPLRNKASATVGNMDYGISEAAQMVFFRIFTDANAASGDADSLGWTIFGHQGGVMTSDAAWLWCAGYAGGWPPSGNAAGFPMGGVTDSCNSGCVRDGWMDSTGSGGLHYDVTGGGTAGTPSDPAQNWYLTAACSRVNAGPTYTVNAAGINHRWELMRPWTTNGKDPGYLTNDYSTGHTINPFVGIAATFGWSNAADSNWAKHGNNASAAARPSCPDARCVLAVDAQPDSW